MTQKNWIAIGRRMGLAVCLLMGLAGGVVAQEATSDVPSWMLGKPTFNGSGYDQDLQTNTKPYTVPTEPGVVSRVNPYAASERFVVPFDSIMIPGQPGVVARAIGSAGDPKMGAQGTVTPVSGQEAVLPMPLRGPSTDSGPANSPANGPANGPAMMDLLPPSGSSPPRLPPTPMADSSTSAADVDVGAVADSDSDSALDSIGSAVASADVPPLQNEVIRWYQYPRRWMTGWDSHAEFGLDGSDGNAETLAIQTGLEMKRKTDAYTFAIDVDYRQASSRSETTEDNGRLNLDYDRLLGGSPWSAFGKFGMEWDEFKAFDLRLNINGGVGYHWIRDDRTTLVTRFGSGASQEIGAPDDDWKAEAVFGIEAERQINSRNKVKAKLDYFPAWEDFADYRLVADVAWEILLNDSENLSLKIAATDRYDSTPQGAEPNDIYYSMLLLYKF